LKLDNLTYTVAGKADPMENIQTFIEDRLQKLQTEILKYKEVVTESRRVQQSNEVLVEEIATQKQHAERLNEQIKAHQQTEEALKARTAQIERQFEELNELARDHGVDPLELDREMNDLRQQLKKAGDDLKQSEGLRQSTEQELASLKVSIEISVAHTLSDVH
jgi:chromosome segregation ATPase